MVMKNKQKSSVESEKKAFWKVSQLKAEQLCYDFVWLKSREQNIGELINFTHHHYGAPVGCLLSTQLKLFHLIHDVHTLRALDVHQAKRSYVYAIVLKVLEIECLDVLDGTTRRRKVFNWTMNVMRCYRWKTHECGKHIMIPEVIHLKLENLFEVVKKRVLQKYRKLNYEISSSVVGETFTVRKNLLMCCGFVSIISL